ncbi:MAG TPA: hypothetical protein VFH61_16150 [Thermoleophilia bacterium]|nr:hypothetical protein [Thermoleophilia bacterium]
MSTPPNTVVDSLAVLVQGGTYEFRSAITHADGSVYVLTGKTVTATVRAKRAPANVLHTDYEDMAVTVGNVDTTAANGGFTITWSPSATYFHAPPRAEMWEDYFMQLYIVTDDSYPQLVRFGVRRVLD